jgi:hypothetical protein
MTTLNISTGDDPEADAHEDELAATAKLEKCSDCGSVAAMVNTEEVVGRTVGIFRCNNDRCGTKRFRQPIDVANVLN